MAKESYLSRLPKTAQKRGDHKKGQIEVVTKRKQVKQIDKEHFDEFSGSALGKNGKRIGILLEDEAHLFVRDPVIYPSGATGCPMRVIGKTQFDGVNGVVALAHCEGFLYMRRIFRHPTRSWETESIRGKRELGMTSRAAMRKELKEELGFPVKSVTKIGTVCPDTALMASTVDVFWAELGEGPRNDDPEDKEAFGSVVKVSPREMAEMITSGEIRDSYTIAAVTLAQLAGLMPALPAHEQQNQERAVAGEER